MNIIKKLQEQKNEKIKAMKAIMEKVKTEERALNAEEQTEYEKIDDEIRALESTIKAEERARELQLVVVTDEKKEELRAEEKEEAEERAFANYIRGVVETRTDVNLTTTDNGAVIPSSIANKIIKKVYDISPIFQLATRYNVGGTLNIPYYDEESQAITMAYATEFTDLESTAGKTLSVELKGFLAGVMSKVSKSLVNNSNFDIVNFVIEAMAQSIHDWIENELLNGTTDKILGLRGITQIITAAATTAVTIDELIDVQEAVPDNFQNDAIWIMNKATRKSIRKLKDGTGNYLLNKDPNAKWGYTLLGKDVYTSKNASTMTAGKNAIFYGDFSGLAVKVSEDINIEVLREKYAAQHALGVIGWIEVDAKVENAQKLSRLTMHA